MGTKQEWLYGEILKRQIVTFDEIVYVDDIRTNSSSTRSIGVSTNDVINLSQELIDLVSADNVTLPFEVNTEYNLYDYFQSKAGIDIAKVKAAIQEYEIVMSAIGKDERAIIAANAETEEEISWINIKQT